MNKFLLMGAAALGLGLTAVRPADAWINHKFSVGLNWQWQSGGNNLFWGMFRNAQPPGPEGGHHPGPGPGPYGGQFPGFQPYQNNEFQYFGQNPPPNGSPLPNPAAAAAAQQQAYAAQQQAYYAQAQNPFRPVSYEPNYGQAPYYHGAYYGAYYAPIYGANVYQPGYYGYYQSPSYWYGR